MLQTDFGITREKNLLQKKQSSLLPYLKRLEIQGLFIKMSLPKHVFRGFVSMVF